MNSLKKSFIILTLTAVIGSSTESVKPLIQLFNTENITDADFIVETSQGVPDTSIYAEDLACIKSYCLFGTWITYDRANYSSESGSGNLISTDATNCQSLDISSKAECYLPEIGSTRRVGSANDIYASSLTTFAGLGYQGAAISYEKAGNITVSNFQSIVITGNQPITLHSRENFEGFSMCIEAPLNGIGGGISNIEEETDLLAEDIKSFHFGCSTKDSNGNYLKHYQLDRN